MIDIKSECLFTFTVFAMLIATVLVNAKHVVKHRKEIEMPGSDRVQIYKQECPSPYKKFDNFVEFGITKF